jgi:hypothetical protein
MKRLFSVILILMIGVFLSASAFALPQMLTDQVTQFKFSNLENLIDADQSGDISPGDQFYGILTVTTLSDVNTTNVTWANGPATNDEITGYFHLTVDTASPNFSYTSSPPVGTTWSLTFKLDAANNDEISLYYDTNKNYSGGSVGDPGVTADIANATDGSLWMQILPGDYVEGGNQSTTYTDPFGHVINTSTNYNWANLTTNNTGYIILPELWKDFSGSAGNYGSHTSDLYWESQLSFTNSNSPANGIWAFSSQDPGYLYATVPEPTTLVLFGLGLLFGAGAIKRKYVK